MTAVCGIGGVLVEPQCAVAGCSDPGRVGHPYLTVGGVPLSLNLCQRHRMLFVGWSIADEPRPVKAGVTREMFALVAGGDFDERRMP